MGRCVHAVMLDHCMMKYIHRLCKKYAWLYQTTELNDVLYLYTIKVRGTLITTSGSIRRGLSEICHNSLDTCQSCSYYVVQGCV